MALVCSRWVGGCLPQPAQCPHTLGCLSVSRTYRVSSQAASRGGAISNSCLVPPTPSTQLSGKVIGSSSSKMSWQPKAGEGCLAESSAGTRRDTAQALLSITLPVSSQVELAEMSQSKEIILSPWPQFRPLAETWLALTEGKITANCGSYYCEGVNGLFGLQLRPQIFLLNITK